MTTGRVSHQQISPIKGQIVIYRPSIGPDSLRDALRATFVGDWEKPSGESRTKTMIAPLFESLNSAFITFCRMSSLLRLHRPVIFLISILIIIDFLFITIDVLIHLANHFKYFDLELRVGLGKNFLLNKDRSFPELYNYMKLGCIVVLMVRAFAKTQQVIYVTWAVVFFIALLDDSLQIHEQLGDYFALALNLPSVLGLYPDDLGELMAWAILAIPVIGALFYGFWHSRGDHTRIGGVLAILLCALFFFAVIFEVLANVVENLLVGDIRKAVAGIFGVVEDGGEMVTITLVCAVGLLIDRYLHRPEQCI